LTSALAALGSRVGRAPGGPAPALDQRLETGLSAYFTLKTWTNGKTVGMGCIFILAHPLPLVSARLSARGGGERVRNP
jgi:hypothetical protein